MRLFPVIKIADIKQNTYFNEPSLIVPDESDLPEFQSWCFQNAMYGASYYNRPIDYLGLGMGGIAGVNSVNMPASEKFPVQFMYKMITYFLGKQNTKDYSWMSAVNGGNITEQPGWINDKQISTFIELFQGIFRSLISNAEFSANPLSEDIYKNKEILTDAIKTVIENKDLMLEMVRMGVNITPGGGGEYGLNSADDMDDFMEKFIDEGADVCTTLSNGIWFSNKWMKLFLSVFTHIMICGKGAIEHEMINGLNEQNEIEPYWLINDIRVPDGDDYAEKAGFIGYYKPFQLAETFNYPNMTEDQIILMRDCCRTNSYNSQMFNLPNITWGTYNGNGFNQTYKVRMYWKAKEFKTAYEARMIKKGGQEVLEGEKGYYMEYIYKADVLAGMLMANYGRCNNTIYKYGNKKEMEFPIQMFQPNTFLGTSISQVNKVFQIADEIGVYKQKIRKEVAKLKGNTLLIRGDKTSSTVKEIVQNLAVDGIHVEVVDALEENIKSPEKTFQVVDMGASIMITQTLIPLIEMNKKDMKELLSASDSLLGQQASYSGASTSQGIINQNNYGISYFVNGTMDYIVRNMFYACKQTIEYCTIKEDVKLSYSVGDKGMAYIDWLRVNSLDWDELFVKMNINDQRDAKERESTGQLLMATVQNGQFSSKILETLVSVLEFNQSKSITSGVDKLRKDIVRLKKEEAQAAKEAAKAQAVDKNNTLMSNEQVQASIMAATAKSRQADIDRKGLWNLLDAFVAAKNESEQQVIKGLIDKTLMSHEASLQPQQQPATAAPVAQQ